MLKFVIYFKYGFTHLRLNFMQSNVIMKEKIVHIFLLAAICCALNGCGTKGPLYIPEQQYPQDTSAKN